MRIALNQPKAATRAAPIRAKLRELFGVDLRSLALLRIGLGVGVLVDTCLRSYDFIGLYTDRGVFPRELVLATQGRGIYFSAHYWASAHPLSEALLFVLAGVAALALLVGWWSRIATLVCWYLVASIQIRQPLVYMGGDSILRMLLFWGMFLPLSARFSVDVARGRVLPGPDRFVSGATVALLLQVCLIYWATGIRKDGPLWWTGQAIFYALHQEAWVTPLGAWLREIPWVIRPFTHATLGLELFGPFLAFVPAYTPVFRMATVAIFVAFHLGLALTMNIGLFPLFSIVAWLPFIPSEAWQWAGYPQRSSPKPAPDRHSQVASVAATICLIYIVVLLAERARVIPRVLPGPAISAGTALRLQQTWNMFAPDPSSETARHDVEKTLADGSQVVERAGSSFRWIVYLGRIGAPRSEDHPLARSIRRYALGHCRPGDTADVRRVAIILTRREIHSEGLGEPMKRTIADVRCQSERVE